MSKRQAPEQITRDGQPLHTRGASFRAASYNPADRTIQVSLGTGAPVLRYDYWREVYYTEILSMDPAHVRLGRMNGGAPLLEDHNQYSVKSTIGRFQAGTVRIEDGELVGSVRLSKAARHADTVGDVIDGILADTSVGYHVHKWEIVKDTATGEEVRTAVDWEPIEGSIVPIPADPTGGVRSQDTESPAGRSAVNPNTTEHPMKTEEQLAAERAEAARKDEERKAAEDKRVAAAKAEARAQEAARQSAIRTAATKLDLDPADEKVRALLDSDTPEDAARAALIDLKAERSKAQGEIRGNVTFTRDEGDVQMRAMATGLEHKAGLVRDLPENARDFRGATLMDFARFYNELRGISCRGRTPTEIATAAFRGAAGHTISDFPGVFANVAYKKMRAAYELSPTYAWWKDLGIREDFADMDPRKIVKLTGLGEVPVVAEGADYEGSTAADSAETATPEKRGAEFRLTLEMVMGDRLGAFLRLPAMYGAAFGRTEAAMVLAKFTGPQTMGDGNPLFHSTHANLSTSGGAPDLTKIAELDGFLRSATDGNGTVIGEGAKVGLFPIAGRNALEQLYSDHYKPTAKEAAITVPLLPENRRYVPGLTTMWFLCSGNPFSMEYGYLQGEGGPVVTTYEHEKSDSVIYHARDVFGCAVIDHQAFAKNPGQ